MIKEILSIKKLTRFYGPRRIGLDSDATIRLMTNKFLYSVYKKELSHRKNLVYIHEESLKEVPKVLERDYGWNRKEAEKQLYKFISNNNIIPVPKNKKNPLLSVMKAECKKRKIEFHPPDSWIIADFKQFGINKAYSGNRHFIKVCKLFGIEVTEIPTVDKRIKQEFRRLYRK